MEWIKQVCTLEQSKLLKEVGIEQENGSLYFSKVSYQFIAHLVIQCPDRSPSFGNVPDISDRGYYIRAFTVAELGKMLPTDLDAEGGVSWSYYHRYNWKGHSVGYTAYGVAPIEIDWYKTETEARATLLILLLGRKLITAEQVNQRLTNL